MPKIANATPTIYNGVKYRSKLEARCAEILDDFGMEFQYEPFKLELLPKFVYMGKTYQPWTYKPDFIILYNKILEVKGFKKADNYVNKRKVILKHILDNDLPYEFYEIYSESHLKSVLRIYEKNNSFNDAYNEYNAILEAKRKLKLKSKRSKKKNNETVE